MAHKAALNLQDFLCLSGYRLSGGHEILACRAIRNSRNNFYGFRASGTLAFWLAKDRYLYTQNKLFWV